MNKKCSQCGLVNFASAVECKRCRCELTAAHLLKEAAPVVQLTAPVPQQVIVPAEAAPVTQSSAGAIKLLLGFLGAMVLIFGVFAPLVKAPIVGSFNYFKNGEGDGVFILVLAFLALLLSLAKWHRLVGAIGVLSLVLIGFSFFNIQNRLSDAKTEYELKMAGNQFAGLGRAMMESVTMEWGWAILVCGAILLIVSSELPGERRVKSA